MRKLALLLALVWRISVYSGDSGRLTFTAITEPRFSHEGRWLHFIDQRGEEISISGSSTIVIRKHEDG